MAAWGGAGGGGVKGWGERRVGGSTSWEEGREGEGGGEKGLVWSVAQPVFLSGSFCFRGHKGNERLIRWKLFSKGRGKGGVGRGGMRKSKKRRRKRMGGEGGDCGGCFLSPSLLPSPVSVKFVWSEGVWW